MVQEEQVYRMNDLYMSGIPLYISQFKLFNCVRNPCLVDLFLNVAAPLLLGAAIYLSRFYTSMGAFIDHHLADGLWAYALLSALLIVWERKMPASWVTLAFVLPLAYEWCQWEGIVAGTGDLLDLAVYFSFYAFALIFNPFFKHNRYHES